MLMDDRLLWLVDWALAASSMFNTIVLCWLGLTVLLNARQKSWGVWLGAVGMLTGAGFFAGHTATLDYKLEDLFAQMGRWWIPSWACVISLPLGWYALMLWYAGFFDAPAISPAAPAISPAAPAISPTAPEGEKPWLSRYWGGRLNRQRACFALALVVACALGSVLLLVNPFRLVKQLTNADISLTLRGVPWLLTLYPPYLLACSLLAIDALRRPIPAARMLADVARSRARPWLIASSLVQFGVSLLVACALGRLVSLAFREQIARAVNEAYLWAGAVDLVATVGCAGAIVLMGKAIVSYEIFTGATLPRRGFWKQWRQFVLLAATYSGLVSAAWALPWRSVYPLLITSVLLAASYALFAWRAFAEREEHIALLRSFFVAPPLAPSSKYLQDAHSEGSDTGISSVGDDTPRAFAALCEGVLNARMAHLVPLGPTAILSGEPLAFPRGAALPALGASTWDEVASGASGGWKRDACPLDSALCGGLEWAVPLHASASASGSAESASPVGVLLLGAKSDGGLYALEEIEVAQSAGARLLESRATANLSGQLVQMQRRRLIEGRLLDHRTRRSLHDDILPQLHAAMLGLSAESLASPTLNQLVAVHRQIADLLREMPISTAPEWSKRGFVVALKTSIEDEFSRCFDAISWHVEPSAERAASDLAPLASEVLFHAARELARNAARYARCPGRPLNLDISVSYSDEPRVGWAIEVRDDGCGFSSSSTRAAQSASDLHAEQGTGRGLAMHAAMVALIGGALSLESQPGRGTRGRITLAPQVLAPG
jgi:signal transduction histidine kinase